MDGVNPLLYGRFYRQKSPLLWGWKTKFLFCYSWGHPLTRSREKSRTFRYELPLKIFSIITESISI